LLEFLHPEVPPHIAEGQPGAALLREADRLQSALADFQHVQTALFSATDEADTVQATVDGHGCLTGLHIEDGLLRLGTETVEQRVNEALENARAAATRAVGAEQEKLLETLGLTDEVMEQIDSAAALLNAGPS
jgi:DNA-binding protein YbaB